MILAAGRGERMRPLTDTVPKPLLRIGDQSLIEYHLNHLASHGFREVIINVSYRGTQIRQALGDGQRYGIRISYSDEDGDALETGGGIFRALPLMGSAAFLVINADIYCDFAFNPLEMPANSLAHLILVDNPPQHPNGDFCLYGNTLSMGAGKRLTFSGIGYYRPELFDACVPGKFPLAPLLHRAIAKNRVSGKHHAGQWSDVGTPERLQLLIESLNSAASIQRH